MCKIGDRPTENNSTPEQIASDNSAPHTRKERLPSLSRRQSDLIENLVEKGFVQKGEIADLLSDPTTDDLTTEARELVREAIYDARRWGAYYARVRSGRRELAKDHKDRMCKIDSLRKRIEATLDDSAWHLANARLADQAVSPDDPRSTANVSETIQVLASLRDRCNAYHDANTKSLVTVGAGNPSEDWTLGFIWRMGVAWRQLTREPIASGGWFERFLDNTFFTEEQPRPIDWGWANRITTAIKRFQLDDKGRWVLRPGDDLDFRLELKIRQDQSSEG
jgi:hypothetical protein